MTSDREHAAMEAAGADDRELEAVIEKLTTTRHLTTQEVIRLMAYCNEREERNQARFLSAVEEMGIW